jgi:hypothetical protein
MREGLKCTNILVGRGHLLHLRSIQVQKFDDGFYIKDYVSQNQFSYNTAS